MTNDLTDRIQEILGSQLRAQSVEAIDVIPIPMSGDRLVRLKTLEGILEELDEKSDEGFKQAGASGIPAVGYFIHVRSRPASPPALQPQKANESGATLTLPPVEGIYLQNGKLNIAFLLRNADLLFLSGEYALSRNIYTTLLRSGEQAGSSLFGIARCLEAEGKLDQARAHYEEAIAYHPTLESYRRLAGIFMQTGRDANGAEILQRALNLKDLNRETRFELHKAAGNCWNRSKRAAEAEAHYEKALGLEPSSDEVRANLGSLHLQFGKTAEAKRHFQDALASNPRNGKAAMGMASCFLSEGDKRTAHDFLIQALEIDLRNPTAILHLVKCAYELKSYPSATRILENYVEIAPVNANLLYSLAGLQFHLKRLDASRATARKILQLDPGHAGALELLKMIEQNEGS